MNKRIAHCELCLIIGSDLLSQYMCGQLRSLKLTHMLKGHEYIETIKRFQ